MCNEAARRITLGQLRADRSQTRIPLGFPEGAPNIAPLDGFRITDAATMIRTGQADGDGDGAGLVTRRWSWPGADGKPVYDFRSDARTLDRGRRLIPIDRFYEFTAPDKSGTKRKTKWALTCPPGLDILPYHGRQMVVLGREAWGRWLDPTVPAGEFCRPLPAGSLIATRA